MAAPGATFRRLLLLRRSLLVTVTARPYGVRASGTGELVTHTGQVSVRGLGERRASQRSVLLLRLLGRAGAAGPRIPPCWCLWKSTAGVASGTVVCFI